MAKRADWRNSSVRFFAGRNDPISAMLAHARAVVLTAVDNGWVGPPFDPIQLAEILKIEVTPCDDIGDARTVAAHEDRFRIEFNPNRSQARVRFSIAHEIAHTFFEDCASEIRNRSKRRNIIGDEWELEMLCNIGAAELLMPIGSFLALEEEELSIDKLLRLREQYHVSTEALLMRVAKLAERPCAMFVCSRSTSPRDDESYNLNYTVQSRAWDRQIPSRLVVPPDSVIGECIAIGYTAKGSESWPRITGRLRVECVGIPPYPGHRYPRVTGIVRPTKRDAGGGRSIAYLKGDATEPRGSGDRLVAHIVNDRTPNWGGKGFAAAVRRKWPQVQDEFRAWARARANHFRLGESVLIELDLSQMIHDGIEHDISVFNMVCQHGYGPASNPRIRYEALQRCLRDLSDVAGHRNASVHMPRIGCGQAGGNWDIVKELIEDLLCRNGVEVTVYDLPGQDHARKETQPLLFS